MRAECPRYCEMSGILFKTEMLTMWVDSLEQVLDASSFVHPSMAASGDGIDTLNFWLSH